MSTRTVPIAKVLLCLALVAAFGGATTMGDDAPTGGKKGAKLGAKAPEFTLTDSSGQERSLSDYKGRLVILEWINPECPYVIRQYRSGAMRSAYEKVKELDAGAIWLAINSTHWADEKANNSWIGRHKLAYPILQDRDGKVGRLYDARRTPHMFVIDREGFLRYHGAIDDNRLGTKAAEDVTNYVAKAVKQLKESLPVTPDHVKAYGCSVKYKD